MTLTKIPLTELKVDALFVERSNRLGLFTLANILDAKLEALSKKKDFNYTWYADLLALLKEHDLLTEFQNRQL